MRHSECRADVLASRGRWRTTSRARVEYFPGERTGFRRKALRLFGRELAACDWGGLAGAPDDALLELGTARRGLHLEFHDPQRHGYCGVRLVEPSSAGLLLVDDGLRIRFPELRRRLRFQVLLRQLYAARRWGLVQIRVVAQRGADDNGYYVWPRLGFDGPLTAAVRRRLPREHRAAQRVLDLMESPAGRAWWRAHGAELELAFDVDPNGRGWKMLRKHWAELRWAERPD